MNDQTFPSEKKSKTLTTLLLDRSFSMTKMRESTVAGINAWLAEQKAEKEDIRITFLQFDDFDGSLSLEKVHVARPVTEIPDLTLGDFKPRGNTPLIDAAMEKGILAIGNMSDQNSLAADTVITSR